MVDGKKILDKNSANFQTVWIVGGGWSLRGFVWERLQGRRVVAVNRAHEVLPWAEVLYFSDLRFWNWYEPQLRQFKGRKCSMGNFSVEQWAALGVERWRPTGPYGIDFEPRCLRHGNSSGYAAMNVAAQMEGVKTLVLLGFDMQASPDKVPPRGTDGVHWHSGYSIGPNPRAFDNMLHYWDTARKPLAKAGIEVLNASPASRIQCFPKCSIDEALERFPSE